MGDVTSTISSSLRNWTLALRRWLVLPSADWAFRPAETWMYGRFPPVVRSGLGEGVRAQLAL